MTSIAEINPGQPVIAEQVYTTDQQLVLIRNDLRTNVSKPSITSTNSNGPITIPIKSLTDGMAITFVTPQMAFKNTNFATHESFFYAPLGWGYHIIESVEFHIGTEQITNLSWGGMNLVHAANRVEDDYKLHRMLEIGGLQAIFKTISVDAVTDVVIPSMNASVWLQLPFSDIRYGTANQEERPLDLTLTNQHAVVTIKLRDPSEVFSLISIEKATGVKSNIWSLISGQFRNYAQIIPRLEAYEFRNKISSQVFQWFQQDINNQIVYPFITPHEQTVFTGVYSPTSTYSFAINLKNLIPAHGLYLTLVRSHNQLGASRWLDNVHHPLQTLNFRMLKITSTLNGNVVERIEYGENDLREIANSTTDVSTIFPMPVTSNNGVTTSYSTKYSRFIPFYIPLIRNSDIDGLFFEQVRNDNITLTVEFQVDAFDGPTYTIETTGAPLNFTSYADRIGQIINNGEEFRCYAYITEAHNIKFNNQGDIVKTNSNTAVLTM